ncbi:hypothetical protein PIB30_088183, partial [Stylosanthes scabra]|nr:hypothetical protein [Stylosanthes scabra]
FVHRNLVISGIGIHEGKVRVVDAHPPLPIGFLHEDDVGYPSGIGQFSDKSCFEECFRLLLYLESPFVGHAPFLLSNESVIWVHSEGVRHDRWINSRHIRRSEGKQVVVFP